MEIIVGTMVGLVGGFGDVVGGVFVVGGVIGFGVVVARLGAGGEDDGPFPRLPRG